MASWIDTHCHLDAPEFDADRAAVRARAARQGLAMCVLPAVAPGNFDTVATLAEHHRDAYALGVHPLCVPQLAPTALGLLQDALQRRRDDPRLVAVGEIGLDYFEPALREPALASRQEWFLREQLKLARDRGLPVLLHVRRSADRLLKALREIEVPGGIAHAFNGSLQQAQAFVARGFRLGFGGTLTFERARQIRALAVQLPLEALVLETDAPDIAPHWLYRTAAERAAGLAQGRNEPGELPRIAAELAALRGTAPPELSAAVWANSLQALPRLRGLLPEVA